jgi:adenylate cyclase
VSPEAKALAKLIILRGDQHRIFELKDQVTSVGRAPDNALWLDDPSLSRRHCEFRRASTGWALRDLGSFNGSFVNNLSISEHALKPGDRIQLGSTILYFVPSESDTAAPSAAGGFPEAQTGDEAREATSRKLQNFRALLEITQKVNSTLDKDQLLELIVDKGIELIHAERGFLILLQDGQPVFKVARKKDRTAIANPEKQISSSVLEGVTKTGEPVITINAQNDLGAFMSIVALEVRSLLCVPLKVKDKILGAVYVDSHVSEQEFNEESLNLLQAFADQAAIALENARLYDEVMESREQERRVRQLFQKYVPADVVRAALNMKDGGRLSSKQIATVLFSDIRNFTATSEKMQPEEVVGFLNDYLQRMVDIVFEEGGIVDKFVGDAVMAVFGAPLVKPDDAVRAVRAALRMLDEVDQFNRDQAAKGGVQIHIGIGLHTGPLIAGNIGSDKKMEYTVIGDTVNVASRTESLNKDLKTELLITQECFDATGHAFPVRAMPPVAVKGKTQKLQVYEVLRSAPGGQPAAQVQTFDVEL